MWRAGSGERMSIYGWPELVMFVAVPAWLLWIVTQAKRQDATGGQDGL
jgi:hypothetical protein